MNTIKLILSLMVFLPFFASAGQADDVLIFQKVSYFGQDIVVVVGDLNRLKA